MGRTPDSRVIKRVKKKRNKLILESFEKLYRESFGPWTSDEVLGLSRFSLTSSDNFGIGRLTNNLDKSSEVG